MPSSIETIPEFCFFECEELSELTFEPGGKVAVFAESAFCACSSLQSICIPCSVEAISSFCFAACGQLSNWPSNQVVKFPFLANLPFTPVPRLSQSVFLHPLKQFPDTVSLIVGNCRR
jgi:hypothetical protein